MSARARSLLHRYCFSVLHGPGVVTAIKVDSAIELDDCLMVRSQHGCDHRSMQLKCLLAVYRDDDVAHGDTRSMGRTGLVDTRDTES